MLIDWFTVGAQVLNFVILVWLMKRFLYKPILLAVDTREKLIATKLADATAKAAEAKSEKDDFQKKNAAFDQQRSDLLQKAEAAAKSAGERQRDEARKTAKATYDKILATMRSDADALMTEVARRAQQEVFGVARKALADLASVGLEERLAAAFIDQVKQMDGPAREALQRAVRESSEPALVRSAFDLGPEQQAGIQRAFDELLGTKVVLSFATSPELISGIEVACKGQKVAWSIDSYLSEMEKTLIDLVQKHTEPVPPAEADKPLPAKGASLARSVAKVAPPTAPTVGH